MQLLRELQQHKLFQLVEAALRQTPEDELVGGNSSGPPHKLLTDGSSLFQHNTERMTVYLLLAPRSFWSFMDPQVRLDALHCMFTAAPSR